MKSTAHLMTLGLAVTVLLLAGCAGTERAPLEPAASRSLMEPASLPILDGRTGDRMTWVEVADAAAAADVVIIGEQHGHLQGLASASQLFEDILARTTNAALSLEFFERDEQTALDDYLSGVTDEKTFRHASGRTGGNYPEGHRAMVEAAKAAGVPVYASNAPRRYVQLARTDGFERIEGLTPNQRRLVTLPEVMTEGRYRDTFFELMSGMAGHGADEEEDAALTPEEQEARAQEAEALVESFYRSQNVWDATMASSIAEALGEGRRPVVHVVGQFHSDFDGGLTQRIRALVPGARIFTVSVESVWSDELREEDRGRADVMLYVGG